MFNIACIGEETGFRSYNEIEIFCEEAYGLDIIHPGDWPRTLKKLVSKVQENVEGLSLSLLSVSPFPGSGEYSIAEISISGEKIKPVLQDGRKDAWVLRWVLPSDFCCRILPVIDGEPGKEHIYPLWLTKAQKTLPVHSEKCFPGSKDSSAEVCVFKLGSAPDLNSVQNRVVPSWWAKAMEKWRFFSFCAKKKGILSMEDVVRLESSLNGLFLSSRGMQECGAEDSAPEWNDLKALEETRRIDLDWWGTQKGRIRRPHVSHEGRICPFHTPESPRIGLQLHLASEAEWQGEGITDGDTIFSAAAGLIPYPLHTDGPRLLMGGKNMKQAETGIRSPEAPLVPGYLEGDAMDEIKVFPAANRKSRRFYPYPGKNVWTAVMPFDGYTYEDGLVVSESLAEAFTINKYKFSEEMFFRSLLPAGEFRRLDQVRFNRLLQDAVKAILDCTKTSLRYGDSLPLDFLGSFFQDQEEQSFFCRYYFHVPSKLSDIRVNAALNRSGRADLVVRFSYTACLPLGFGDKITGRHGNKGVVTHILPDRERPVAMIAGREVPIDLIISPCSILGRKNLGQILEMLHGDLIWGRDQGIPGQYDVPGDRLLTAVEVRDHAIPALRDSLGADDEGHFPVRLSDGRIVRAFAGPQYFIRLHHHCGRKLQARGSGGPVNCLTGHPDRGGARTAQKMGEMEHWSLLSYPGNGEGLLSSLREKRSPADSAGKMREVFSLALLALGFRVRKEGETLTLCRLSAADRPGLEAKGYSVAEMSVYEADQYLRTVLADERPDKKISMELLRIYSISVNKDGEKDDLYSPGDAVGAEAGKRSLPFDNDGAFWVPLDLFTGRMDLSGTPGAESPDTGFFRLCDMLKSRSRFKGSTEGEGQKYVQKVVRRYTNLLLSFLGGKDGLIRGSMMGRRFSSSGRSVIVPVPDLSPDEVCLPFAQAAEMLAGAPDIIERLRKKQNGRFPGAFSNDRGKAVLSADAGTLDELLSEEPVWCLMVRQPSLHRHSVQAFRARVWEKNVIGLPPLVTPGFNADFDGDTMAVFLPPEPFAGDLSGFSLLENPGIVGTGEPAFASGLDLALGWNALSEEEKKGIFESAGTEFKAGLTLKKAITSIMPFLGTKTYEARKEILGTLQKKVCKASTGEGSLSPISFQRLCDGFHSAFPGRGWIREARSGDRKFLEKLESVLKENSDGSIGLLVNSGAKGGMDDLRAMGAYLGDQELFRDDEKDTPRAEGRDFIDANFWEGLDERQLFTYSYSCRDSMASKKLAVAEAGYFSRLLAEGLFETGVTDDDCGAGSGMALGFEKTKGLVTVRLPGVEEILEFPSKGDLAEDLLRIAWGRVPVGMERCLGEKDIRSVADAWLGKKPPMEADLKAHLRCRKGMLEIRSPLACRCGSPGLCSMCCGADLAGKPYDRTVLVPVGTRVGLSAAQAIGERGTQLAMKRFHQVSGSSGGESKTDILSDVLVNGNRGGSTGERFRALLQVLSSGEGKAEKDLPQALIHFEIALRNEKGLRAEASSRTSGAFLSALSFERAGEILKSALQDQSMLSDDFSCVKSRLLWR